MAKSKAKKIKLIGDNELDELLGVSIGSALGIAQTSGEHNSDNGETNDAVKPNTPNTRDAHPRSVQSQNQTPDSKSKPRITKAVLQRARSGGGRWVVRVLLTPAQTKQDLDALSRDLRRAIGTGTRIEDNVLVVQGDIPDRVETWFKEYGVTKIVR